MIILFWLSLMVPSRPWVGAENAVPAKKENVLDFEADVIEGEKKRPDIFLQMGNQKQTMDSVLYGRKDFNDFHRVDRRWRPTFHKGARK